MREFRTVLLALCLGAHLISCGTNEVVLPTDQVQILQESDFDGALIRIVDFSATPTAGDIPLLVTFSCKIESDSTESIRSILLDFGDSSSPAANCESTHTYTKSGNYTATVSVMGSDGKTVSAKTALSATTPGTCSIPLEWDPNIESDLAGYRVYRRETSQPNYPSTPLGETTLSRFTSVDLVCGKQYCFSVSAFDTSNNESGLSNEHCETAVK